MPYKNREDKNAYARQWYAQNKGKHLALVLQNRQKARRLVTEYLLGLKSQPCLDCGGAFDPEVMDFDHVEGVKGFNISSAVRSGYSIETVREEVAKCELVCANCHRLRSKARRR